MLSLYSLYFRVKSPDQRQVLQPGHPVLLPKRRRRGWTHLDHSPDTAEWRQWNSISVTERTKGMIWKMSQRPTFNRFETKAESSRNFMKVQSTFAFRICHSPPHLALQPRELHFQIQIQAPVCRLRSIATRTTRSLRRIQTKRGSLCCERFQWFHGRFHLL